MYTLILLVMEFCEAENGKEREEEKHRIKEDKPRNGKPSNICLESDKEPRTTRKRLTTKDHKRR